MRRRSFLRVVMVGLVALAVFLRIDLRTTRYLRVRWSWVWECLPPRRVCAHAGLIYGAQNPSEASVDALLAVLDARRAALGPPAGEAVRGTSEVLNALVQKDLAGNDVVMIDGWLVTRTEARLCALATLAKPF